MLEKNNLIMIRRVHEENSYTHDLPRQDLMSKQRMAEMSYLWAEWYLIYTLFTPFDLGRNTTRKERTKDMIRILFVCWGKRFQ